MEGTTGDLQTSFVSVPVPVDLVEAVYAFISARRASDRGSANSSPLSMDADDELDADDEPDDQGEEEWDVQSLRALARHHNKKLRSLLLYLAERSGTWVPIEEAMPAAGIPTGRGAGGWFSRLNRSSMSRYRRELPIEREWQDDRVHYRIYEDTADVLVRELTQSS